jgi:CheY-like chemotaxis protein
MKNLPKLFLVEDDAIFAMLMKKSLKKIEYDHQLTTFKNGLEILKHIKENSKDVENLPDVILLDLNMPIMDGWQFLEELVQIYDDLPKKIDIYVLSSSIFTDDIEKTKQYKIVTDYLVKPVSKDKLNEILSNFFD